MRGLTTRIQENRKGRRETLAMEISKQDAAKILGVHITTINRFMQASRPKTLRLMPIRFQTVHGNPSPVFDKKQVDALKNALDNRDNPKEKTCKKCGSTKPIERFKKHAKTCLSCINIRRRQRDTERAEIVASRRRAYNDLNHEHIRETNAQWRNQNKEKINARRRERDAERAEIIHAQGKRYRDANKEKINERRKKSYEANRPKRLSQARASGKRRHKILKLEIIENYGGKCTCCGEANYFFLTIDHIDNKGAQHRREVGTQAGRQFYKWLKNNGFPKDNFQLLCFNCNSGKQLNGGICPHEGENELRRAS
jgi:hypothetical protein